MPTKIEEKNIVIITDQEGLVTVRAHLIDGCLQSIKFEATCPDIDSKPHKLLIPHDGTIKAIDDLIGQLVGVRAEVAKYTESTEKETDYKVIVK
jgi:hypothetical protein